MPKSIDELRRIKRLHDSGSHARCDRSVCVEAARIIEAEGLEPDSSEVDERAYRIYLRALMDEIEAQNLDPAEILDDVDGVRDELDKLLPGEQPSVVDRLQARAELKLA